MENAKGEFAQSDNPQKGYQGMTDEEIYEAGKDGFRRGWKNIPPYSIAALPRDRRIQKTAAEIWQEGWAHEKSVSKKV